MATRFGETKCISHDFAGGIDMLNFGAVFGDRTKNTHRIHALVGLLLLIVTFDCAANSDHRIAFRIGCRDACYKVAAAGARCG
ncbi:Uncharacterised protein [Vibrio cholerae]|uniref:Uncharacterized protein n=1 Tax=Vibrio cholerae TaxID=666 RepID=A0A655Y1A6_VIBCL|nr:Uncharacterised protein [Vibrio cholerae]CSC25830.1 Uncharacterised protein [Vibrio cholerae]